MEIFASVLDLSRKHNNLLWEVQCVLGDESLKFDDPWYIFDKRRGLNFKNISVKLREKGLEFSDKDLLFVLQVLLSNYKRIVRNEYWNKDTEYELLDRQTWEHKSQEVHYSFEDDMISEKVFLLISDTHIGNDKMFNSKLLHNLYEYSIMNGAKKCFHLGDLFEGCKGLLGDICKITSKQVDDFEEEFCRQVNLFINEYPKANPDEFMTYCLIGNHDEAMNNFLKFRNFFSDCDLKKLTMYDPSFYVFPRTHWCANLNGIDFHFNHRLYMSVIIDDLKINRLSDIEKRKAELGNLMSDVQNDVLVSGHLHKGIIYTDDDLFRRRNKLYLGIPSTSNFNVGGVVGYLVYMYPESNSMEVSILGSDNDLNIYEIDRISWNFGKNNKTYSRTL